MKAVVFAITSVTQIAGQAVDGRILQGLERLGNLAVLAVPTQFDVVLSAARDSDEIHSLPQIIQASPSDVIARDRGERPSLRVELVGRIHQAESRLADEFLIMAGHSPAIS